MKAFLHFAARLARAAVAAAGLLAWLAAAAQFTNLPWRAYRSLSEIPRPAEAPPTHILVMGGSGIPGESGLMRTFYAAQAAAQHPQADVLVALPLGTAQSGAAKAYLGELRLRGVPAKRIRILDGGRNTREQALRLAEYLADRTNSAAGVLLVTSPEHVRRSAACIRKVCNVPLGALPAFPLDLEDPLPWRAADLDAAGPAPAARATVPDIGSSMHLRYNLWTHLHYTHEILREAAALLYYRLRGWI